jgi:hypothetical protein
MPKLLGDPVPHPRRIPDSDEKTGTRDIAPRRSPVPAGLSTYLAIAVITALVAFGIGAGIATAGGDITEMFVGAFALGAYAIGLAGVGIALGGLIGARLAAPLTAALCVNLE